MYTYIFTQVYVHIRLIIYICGTSIYICIEFISKIPFTDQNVGIYVNAYKYINCIYIIQLPKYIYLMPVGHK